MESVLEMIFARIIFAMSVAALSLSSGCSGKDPASVAATQVATLANVLLSTKRPPHGEPFSLINSAQFAAIRPTLESGGQPILLITVNSLSFVDLLTPAGMNSGVQTWSSARKVSVSLRDDILVATRGFGNDLMSATAPSVALISSGNGQFSRSYFELDGGDRMVRSDFSCQLSQSGNQTLTILGAIYTTRTVLESCDGPGNSFQNEYWFDQDDRLRQSTQHFSARNTSLLVQRIVD